MNLYQSYKQDGGPIKRAFNPNLANSDIGFQNWYKANTLEGKNNIPYSTNLDYDYFSFYRNGDYQSYKGGHFPDTYKRSNHDTFSDESIYSGNGSKGHWMGNKFIRVGNYKANGGPLEFGSIIAGTGASILDAVNPPNQFGNQGMGTNIAKSALTLGAAGAQFGPLGAAAGAVIGAGVGVIKGREQAKEAKRLESAQNNQIQRAQLSQYQARAAQDPNLTSGTKGTDYYGNGGELFAEFSKFKAKGGSLSKLSSDSVEVKGPSHAQGGVKLNTGDEVEGGETIKGDYVFSKKLGFAQLHKPLAKTIKKLEERPVTKTSIDSLGRLRKREDALMLLQEMVRHQNNMQ